MARQQRLATLARSPYYLHSSQSLPMADSGNQSVSSGSQVAASDVLAADAPVIPESIQTLLPGKNHIFINL